MEVTCPKCNHLFLVDVSQYNQRVRCVSCSKKIKINDKTASFKDDKEKKKIEEINNWLGGAQGSITNRRLLRP